MSTKPDFKKADGLIPVIVQDHETLAVLMLGYMNQEAYEKTLEEQRVTFYSRSKERLWTKGESSGNFLDVIDVRLDCDQDTLLILAKPHGPTCHTGDQTCFGDRQVVSNNYSFLDQLTTLIKSRKLEPQSGSYTSKLFESGVNKIVQKVGEEAVEVVIDAISGSKEGLLEESADLLFHLLVLLEERDSSLTEVIELLKERHLDKK